MVELGPAVAAGEPWALTDVYGPGPESSWGPREVLAHVAEMLPFWLGEIERIVDAGRAGGGEPPAFGRLEEDPSGSRSSGRDRDFPGARAPRAGSTSRAGGSPRASASSSPGGGLGRHPTRGDLSIAELAERLIVAHAEGHVTQLRETVGAAG